jgi:hypothetical protein
MLNYFPLKSFQYILKRQGSLIDPTAILFLHFDMFHPKKKYSLLNFYSISPKKNIILVYKPFKFDQTYKNTNIYDTKNTLSLHLL